jgi:hypothetical protein
MNCYKVKFTSKAPLIVSNNRTVNPVDPYNRAIKALTDKGSRKMTDEDHENLLCLKFHAALYHSEEWRGLDEADGKEGGYPFIPADNLQTVIQEGGSRSRKGKDIQRAVVVMGDHIPLLYDGPKDRDKLYNNLKFRLTRPVRPNRTGGTVMSCRPCFPEWALEFEVGVNHELLNMDTFEEALRKAGSEVGMGNWRPRYGRFIAEIL